LKFYIKHFKRGYTPRTKLFKDVIKYLFISHKEMIYEIFENNELDYLVNYIPHYERNEVNNIWNKEKKRREEERIKKEIKKQLP
jgi:hypothetical protein